MTQIKSIDRAAHRQISQRIEQALKELGDELGIEFRAGGGQYAFTDESTFRIRAMPRNADGTVESQPAKDFKRFAPALGFSPDDLGRQFWHGGNLYEITGYRPNARKNNITVARIPDRKGFVVPHTLVRAALPKKVA